MLARPAAIWLTALLLLALAVLGLVAIGARPETPFPMAVTTYHGGPAQDGAMAGPGPAGIPAIVDDVPLPGTMDNLSATLVRDGLVYAADLRGHVTALAAGDLALVWRVDDLGPGAHAPVLLGPNLVVAAEDGSVVALDATTGERRWSRQLDLDTSAPLAGAGRRGGGQLRRGDDRRPERRRRRRALPARRGRPGQAQPRDRRRPCLRRGGYGDRHGLRPRDGRRGLALGPRQGRPGPAQPARGIEPGLFRRRPLPRPWAIRHLDAARDRGDRRHHPRRPLAVALSPPWTGCSSAR